MIIGLLFAILYSVLVGIGYLIGYSGFSFFIMIFCFALILILIQFTIGPKTVEWSMHVRYVNENEYPKLHRIINDLSDKANLPVKPKVGISKLRIPNAFAFGRTKRSARVCVTEGILKLLNEEELKAVIGHEISHINHRDVAVITMLSVIPMVCYVLYISFFWGGMFGRSQRNSGGMIAIGLLALVVYFITSLLVMYGSRIREYYADHGSVKLGNQPHQLATALYKISLGSARLSKKTLKQSEGMKAFFLNDPTKAIYEVRELKEIDLDMSGTIDINELIILSTKNVKIGRSDKLMEILSTHPNMVKRIKHLSSHIS